MKQPVIKITATLLIPYDPDKFGDTGRAEAIAVEIESCMRNQDGVTVDEWRCKKTSVGME